MTCRAAPPLTLASSRMHVSRPSAGNSAPQSPDQLLSAYADWVMMLSIPCKTVHACMQFMWVLCSLYVWHEFAALL